MATNFRYHYRYGSRGADYHSGYADTLTAVKDRIRGLPGTEQTKVYKCVNQRHAQYEFAGVLRWSDSKGDYVWSRTKVAS
jgi:hypothetical protein